MSVKLHVEDRSDSAPRPSIQIQYSTGFGWDCDIMLASQIRGTGTLCFRLRMVQVGFIVAWLFCHLHMVIPTRWTSIQQEHYKKVLIFNPEPAAKIQILFCNLRETSGKKLESQFDYFLLSRSDEAYCWGWLLSLNAEYSIWVLSLSARSLNLNAKLECWVPTLSVEPEW